MTAILEGGRHAHEHFDFDDQPSRIMIQSNQRTGMYSRDKTSIYQDTGRIEDGCRVYSYVRTVNQTLDGFLETE